MYIAFLLLCLLAAAAVSGILRYEDVAEEFKAFKEKYKRNYTNEAEEKLRMKIFADNKYKIEQHNERYKQGLETYTMAVNKFGDLLHHEFLLSQSPINTPHTRRKPHSVAGEALALEDRHHLAIDWRKRGAITPVRDEQSCNCNYAISAVEALEAQHFRKTGKLISLSVQEIIDCSTGEGNRGCHGGNKDWAFEYVVKNGGIESEASYPYENHNGTCRHDKKKVVPKCSGYIELPAGDERTLTNVVYTMGPVCVWLDSSGLQFYKKGIYYSERCGSEYKDLKREVLVIGFNTTKDEVPYYIVKNSWGKDWGEEGYVKMSRSRNNNCGIATAASIPFIA